MPLLPSFLELLLVLLVHHHCLLIKADSTQLSSLSSVDHPLVVQTAHGTSISVAGRGVLSTSSFHVPTVLHVPNLTMQLMSARQITNYDVASFLSWTLVVFRILAWGF